MTALPSLQGAEQLPCWALSGPEFFISSHYAVLLITTLNTPFTVQLC